VHVSNFEFRSSSFELPFSSFQLTLQTSLEPTWLVKRNLAVFPTGRKRLYNSGRKFPTGRKRVFKRAAPADKTSREQGCRSP